MQNSAKILFLVFSSYSIIIPAQAVDTDYFDQHGGPSQAEQSYYFSIGKKNKQGYFYDSLKSFYTKTKALRSVEIRDQFGNPIGNFESFYSNGTIHLKGRYERKHFKLFLASFDSTELSIEQFNDSAGRTQVKNYNGFIDGRIDGWLVKGKIVNGLRDSVWTMFYDNGKIFCHESWHDGELVDGISYDSKGKEYYYKSMFILPEPSEDNNQFYERMSDEVDYPKDAQRRGIVGTVLVEFTIARNGALTSPHVVKGLGFGCDEEAVRVISQSKPWKPALKRGQPIARDVTIPFVFRLK